MKKSNRKVLRIEPSQNSGWRLSVPGETAYRVFDKKEYAVATGRNLCRDILENGGLAQLVVHKKNGKIQTEYTYGKDPRKSKG